MYLKVNAHHSCASNEVEETEFFFVNDKHLVSINENQVPKHIEVEYLKTDMLTVSLLMEVMNDPQTVTNLHTVLIPSEE